MKFVFSILFYLICFQFVFSQEYIETEIDSLYKEDQFYAGVTYNLIGKKSDGISQSGFSTGFSLGFINDMPINENRNVAIGLGLGISFNSFNQNLLINKDDLENLSYSLLIDGNTYSKNKFTSQLIEVPIEFRWRTSTPSSYKFWRIYTGFKIGYAYYNSIKYKGDLGSFKYKNLDNFSKIQYGLTLSAGYNTWNMYVYYALNPVFSEDALIGGKKIEMKAVKIGLMFYVL